MVKQNNSFENFPLITDQMLIKKITDRLIYNEVKDGFIL